MRCRFGYFDHEIIEKLVILHFTSVLLISEDRGRALLYTYNLEKHKAKRAKGVFWLMAYVVFATTEGLDAICHGLLALSLSSAILFYALNVKIRSKLLVSVSKLVDFIPAAIVSLSKLSFTVSKLSFSFKGYTFLGTPEIGFRLCLGPRVRASEALSQTRLDRWSSNCVQAKCIMTSIMHQ